MGKKSRLKRERREAKLKAESHIITTDNRFKSSCDQLRSLFSNYSAEEVLVSLNISDLWVPNISSQIKHTLAFAVASSMVFEDFTGELRLDSYRSFQGFAKQLYSILPNFPMLEDFIPEPDWGEIKYQLDDSLYQIFYGGCVERVPDFITAFLLLNKNNAQAKLDIDVVLAAQNHILKSIDKTCVGEAINIRSGHIEIPAELFWKKCYEVLFSLSKQLDLKKVSKALVTKLGEFPNLSGEANFVDAVFTGRIVSCLFVNSGGHYFPLSLRNSASVVIEFWSGKENTPPVESVSSFIATRFSNIINGPFKIFSPSGTLPYIFSSLILGDEKPILIFTLNESKLSQLPDIERAIARIFASDDWAIASLKTKEFSQIRSADGKQLRSLDQLIILTVTAKASTVPGILKIPKTVSSHVMPLPDFVTIFDSIKDSKELQQYWKFIDTNSSIMKGFVGAVDQFAAFRDSNAVLIDGAITPSMMILDPSWGSSWRYKVLEEYWGNTPPNFPDMSLETCWKSDRDQENLYRLKAKRLRVLSWSVVVQDCVLHFALEVDAQPIEAEDGRILELLIHCIADSINQRQHIIARLPIFRYQKITMICRAKMDALVTIEDIDNSSQPLFENWKIQNSKNNSSITVLAETNLQHVQKYLSDANDSSFETSAVLQWVEGLSLLLKLSNDSSTLKALANTSNRPARFNLRVEERSVDVPYYADPAIPEEENYKIARRNLAIIFREIGAREGEYQLEEAKLLIDQVRDKFRNIVHDQVIQFKQLDLARFCIEQLDKLTAEYDHKEKQIEMSLNHEVGYDRTTELAEANEKFIKNSRNYRYLLEACLSLNSTEGGKVSEDEVMQLVANIDWLLVLYTASDTLHNGLDVAGVKLDSGFVPDIFYLEMNEANQNEFSREIADTKLGIGLIEEDKVDAIKSDCSEWEALNNSFQLDIGVSLDNFLQTLHVLYRWPSLLGTNELTFSYSASANEINEVLIKAIEGITPEEVSAALSLVTLNPQKIRKLIGKSEYEIDVPLWEHNKRGNRYTIKPLIQNEQGDFIWGAAMVERAARIWKQTLSNGYMPADYDWPNIKDAVNKIKTSLEKQLEKNTEIILKRATPYSIGGIDFMRRFRQENFEDVGDFDGLAYWPETNTWVTVECKYNQPAFCLKDARRLRDRIFDENNRKAHIPKIIKRRNFLITEMSRICKLLDWPASKHHVVMHELYVSRDIYWWMRNPPYSVETKFVRVDALEQWLNDRKLVNGGGNR